MNINLLRAGDKITVESGETLEIAEAWTANDIYQFKVGVHDEKEIILSYNLEGKSLEHESLNITSYELVEKPEDKLTFFTPKFEVRLMPVLVVNGEEKIVATLKELDGLEIKGDQTLKADYKYTIIATLQKKSGRTITNLKSQNIICQSAEECEEKLKEIEGMFHGEDEEDAKRIGKLFTMALAKDEGVIN